MATRNLLIPTILVLLLLAVPAQAKWHGKLETEIIQIAGGQVEGELAAMRFGTTYEPSETPTWHLAGRAIQVITENTVSNATLGIAINDPPYETSARHGNFEASATIRGGATLAVVPLSEMAPIGIQSAIGQFQASPSNTFYEGGPLERPSEHRTEIDISQTTRFQAGSRIDAITIYGDLILDNWEVDWIVSHDEGNTWYPSGREETPLVDGQPDFGPAHVGRTHQRDTFFYIQDAELTLTGVSAGSFEAYMHQWSGQWPEGLVIGAATGTMTSNGQEMVISDQAVELPGPAFVDGATVEGNLLSIEARTQAGALRIGGIEFAAPAGDERRGFSNAIDVVWQQTGTTWLAPMAALLLAGMALVGIRFQKPFWYVRWRMHRGHHEFVVTQTPRFFANASKRPTAAMIHALALLGVGQFKEASQFLYSLVTADRPEEPTWHYLVAMALAGDGAFGPARHHLARCVKAAPQFIEEIRQSPILSRMIREDPAAFDAAFEPGEAYA